ncbi:MAG: efflux RND transporter permease subunit, partial [Acidobacteriota bacterium]
TLISNGFLGLALVLLVLALFLELRLAAWVALGVPVSFLGALWLMPTLDLSINIASLFGFIVVLGIVVDDSIVVGENVFRHRQAGKEGIVAAIDGAREVAVPVVFSVLTTIAAFAPMTVVPGNLGKAMRVIPLIVISTLVFSLVESLLILPSHLAHLKSLRGDRKQGLWRRIQGRFSAVLERIIERDYTRVLNTALAWRYTVFALALAALLLTLGYLGGGHLGFSPFPRVEDDNLAVFLTMPQGTTAEVTWQALEQIENAAQELRREVEARGDLGALRHIVTSIGDQPFHAKQSVSTGGVATSYVGSHLGEVHVELAPAEERSIAGAELIRRWRELTGPVPDAVEVVFNSSLFSAGEAINIQLAGDDLDELRRAASEVRSALTAYPGVFDVADSFRVGKQQMKLQITPEAESLGLTLADLAHQVRQAFYGDEVQRIQRGRDEVKVMVRYTDSERRSIASVEDMRIRSRAGEEVPFAVAGTVEMGRGFASIHRADRRRTVNVTASVDEDRVSSNDILADLQADVLPRLLAGYQRVSYSLEGAQQQQAETMGGLARGFLLALFIIYSLLAIPFRSYLQPLIVGSAVPFGIIGACWGHVLMGKNMTIFSLFGIVAVTGVVVNDSLVLVDFVNRARRQGATLEAAIRQAGMQRFRPIVLTSLTTFVGLTPLLLEKSLQAQFLIPMATSIAFGVLFTTAIILLFVPATYYILEDLKSLFRRGERG